MICRSGVSFFLVLMLFAACCGVFATAGLSAAGTDSPTDNNKERNVGFSSQVQPLFDANCVVCHQSAGASGGLDLEEGDAYKSIVSVKSQESSSPRVDPGKPETSYLLRKIEGTHIQAGGSGEQMPPSGKLSTALIDVVRSWISAGAANN